MQTQPQKLSLNEFYLVAQTYEPGSVEFNDVFETAVRMYPNDEIANLNAANSAMQRKDVENAKRYLQKGEIHPRHYMLVEFMLFLLKITPLHASS